MTSRLIMPICLAIVLGCLLTLAIRGTLRRVPCQTSDDREVRLPIPVEQGRGYIISTHGEKTRVIRQDGVELACLGPNESATFAPRRTWLDVVLRRPARFVRVE